MKALYLLTALALNAQQSADQLFEQAVRLQQAGKWAEAEQAYRTHVKRFGATSQALANLGAVLTRQERFSDAVSAYSRALKLAPQLLPIRLNLGLAYFKSGQLAPAVAQFTAVLDKEPGHLQARQLRAICLLELERFEEAARDYSALMPSTDANVRLGLASAKLKLGQAAEAEQLMESLFDRDEAPVKLLLGQVLVQNGKLDEGQNALERAAALDPKLPTVYLNLGAVYWRRQETDAAIAEWRKELAAHPESFQANVTLGAGLSIASPESAEAEPLLRKAVALKPASAMPLYYLAKLVWQQEKPEAVGLLERAVKADANYLKAHNLLGSIYQRLGRKEDAAKAFAEVRRISREELRRSEDLFETAPQK